MKTSRCPIIDHVKGYKKVNPLFVPKLLINLGAGHISMKYGFMVFHIDLQPGFKLD